jgi:hypothetical protein
MTFNKQYTSKLKIKNKITLSDGDAIGGGFIFRNENTQHFDQRTSVPVPVPILHNINLVWKIYAGLGEFRMQIRFRPRPSRN